MNCSRYKKRGWRGESYRHYLAAKGIKTSSRRGRKLKPLKIYDTSDSPIFQSRTADEITEPVQEIDDFLFDVQRRKLDDQIMQEVREVELAKRRKDLETIKLNQLQLDRESRLSKAQESARFAKLRTDAELEEQRSAALRTIADKPSIMLMFRRGMR